MFYVFLSLFPFLLLLTQERLQETILKCLIWYKSILMLTYIQYMYNHVYVSFFFHSNLYICPLIFRLSLVQTQLFPLSLNIITAHSPFAPINCSPTHSFNYLGCCITQQTKFRLRLHLSRCCIPNVPVQPRADTAFRYQR